MSALKNLFSTVLAFALASLVFAQRDLPQIPISQDPRIVTKNIGIDQKLGSKVPGDVAFQDESGKEVKFGDYLGKRPILLIPIFYQCEGTCALIASGTIKILNKMKVDTVGKDFDVLILGINHTETPAMARERKMTLTDYYSRPGTQDGWHCLVGTESNIKKITNAIGFRFTFDPKTKLVNHPAGIMVLTPDGTVSKYFYGVEFSANLVRDALVAASRKEIGLKEVPILFGCFQYNPVTGGYTMIVHQLMKVLGFATIAILGLSIAIMSYKNGKKKRLEEGAA